MSGPILALVAPSLDDPGGQGVQAHALAAGLRGDGYSVRLVPINPRFPRAIRSLRGRKYVRTVINEALYLASLPQLRDADLVHIFSAAYWSFLLAPAPAILAARLLRKPLILHYHSGEAEDHLGNWRSAKPFLRLVDQIVVPSAYLQRVFASHGYRVTVIPNGIDPSRFQYRERSRLRPRCLSVRNLERHYRVDDNVRAFAELKMRYPEATLTIAGYGSEEERLRQLVEELDISGVRFAGRVEPAQLPSFFESADVFLNSSVVDNQPVSILEAMAAGVPVVSTPTGDIENMLCGGEAGILVPQCDPQSMAAAVGALIESPDAALRLARRARKEIGRHAWASIRDLWRPLYDAVIRDGNRSHTKVHKLLRMDRREIAGRALQEASKHCERLSAPFKRRRKGSPHSLERFIENAERRFFKGAFDPHLPMALAIAAPQHCKELIAAAERLCRHRFDLLGYSNLDFGDPLNWHLDPISGRQAPLAHWTRLNHLDYAAVGDSKVIWELNRHQWLVQLGQAYRLTREERYASAAVRDLTSWLDANPPGFGINWTSSLEVALRLIAWCWALLLIRDSRAMTQRFFQRIVDSIDAHANHIERYLSFYFSPNTHLTGEALGLLYAGLLFPDLKRSARWRGLGLQILEKESERQIFADGVYFELSTCYQRYTADTYLHLLMLAGTDFEISPRIRERVRSLFDFLVAIANPDASMPSIGDADGGWLLPLSRSRPGDIRATLSTASVVFNDPHCAAAAKSIAPDTLWLLGTSAAKAFQGIPRSFPAETSRMFPDGGFAVMRSGWSDRSHALIFDTGALGCPTMSGHGHADLLSVQCTVFGRPYLVDAGTCCYFADEELRNFLRGTSAHSTVLIDGKDQAEPAGPFSWERTSRAQLRQWLSNERFAFADAAHDGYVTLDDPVLHRRRVLFVKDAYWVIIDDLSGHGDHRADIRFQFAPMNVQFDSLGWTRATADGKHGLMLRCFATQSIRSDIRVGCRAPLEGWIAPNYGQLEPAPAVVYSLAGIVPMRAVTVLWPSENIACAPPRVDIIHDDEGQIAGLEFPDRFETIVFEDSGPVVERAVAAAESV